MNALGLVILPARLGYEVARRALDVAAGAGQMFGLFKGDGAEPPVTPRPATPEAGPEPAPAAKPPRTAGAVESAEVELIRRVEAEVLRDADAPGFSVHVNPIGGVVRLSGRAESTDHVRELQRRALSVPGVKRVEHDLEVPMGAPESSPNGSGSSA